MFKRKLQALEHPNAETFTDIKDVKQVRALVLWLENMKIRHYKIEDRENLRQIESPKWNDHFKKYLEDLECPFQNGNLTDQLEWLLGYAIKLEYADNIDKYKTVTSESIQKTENNAPKVVSSSPLDSLDFECDDFKNGVKSLAQVLNVTNHPDHLITLQAISKVICERLTSDALQNPNSMIPKGKPFPYQDTNAGLESNDKVLDGAGKIVKLLFIQDLRNLQTRINECIVAVQKVTANPKTDTKLGKVGF